MKRMQTKQPTSSLLGLRRRSRTGSLGDVHSRSPIRTPHPSPRPPYRPARSMSICAPPVSQNPQAAKNIRKNSVISLGEHFSSLLSISSQVRQIAVKESLMMFVAGGLQYWGEGGSQKKLSHSWSVNRCPAGENKEISQRKVSIWLKYSPPKRNYSDKLWKWRLVHTFESHPYAYAGNKHA